MMKVGIDRQTQNKTAETDAKTNRKKIKQQFFASRNITQTKSTGRLHYFPSSYPTKLDRMTNTQIRCFSPGNKNRGKDSHFSDFYSALPALRDTTLFTATREAELFKKRREDNQLKSKLVKDSIEAFEKRSKIIAELRAKYNVSETEFYPNPTMSINQVEGKMIKIFKAKKRSYALQKLQGITKLIQAKRMFKVNKNKRTNAAIVIQRFVRIRMQYK